MEIVLLDLFSGIGGFAEGIKRSGIKIKTHYFSEIDKHCIANYKYNFKNSIYVGNVTNVRGAELEQRPNIITFGFPCQDLSIAGKGEGLGGSRSSLFFQALRIIRECNPKIFVFENVKGLFSSNHGKDFEIVLRSIADIGLYECEWQLLNTSWVLPQNRERVYFVGHLTGKSRPRVFPFTKADFVHHERKLQKPNKIAQTLSANDCKSWVGNFIDYRISNLQGGKISNTIRSGGRGSLTNKHNWDMVEIRPVLTPDRQEKRQNGRRFKENGDPSFTLNCQDKHGVQIGSKIRRLTEIECERLQGFPDNWTKYGDYDGKIKEVSKTQRYKMLGNAVTCDIVQLIFNRIKE